MSLTTTTTTNVYSTSKPSPVQGRGFAAIVTGSAEQLYESVHREIFSLDSETRIYPGRHLRIFTPFRFYHEQSVPEIARRLRSQIHY